MVALIFSLMMLNLNTVVVLHIYLLVVTYCWRLFKMYSHSAVGSSLLMVLLFLVYLLLTYVLVVFFLTYSPHLFTYLLVVVVYFILITDVAGFTHLFTGDGGFTYSLWRFYLLLVTVLLTNGGGLIYILTVGFLLISGGLFIYLLMVLLTGDGFSYWLWFNFLVVVLYFYFLVVVLLTNGGGLIYILTGGCGFTYQWW